MKFLVTYGAIDSEYGNPFWHTFLLLSIMEDNKKIEVVDNWGYYGSPSSDRNAFLSTFKIKLGLDVDMTGNHGILKHEELRFLDAGKALHGATFEVTQENFQLLQQRCNNMAADQANAIKEVVDVLGIKPMPKKLRNYAYEHRSKLIYDVEKLKAEQETRSPRLKPFEFNVTMTLWGPTLNKSHTCKSQIISLLNGVLSNDQINRLTENGKHPTVSRYSGRLENIYLHSSGPLRQHEKASGKRVYSRDLADAGVKLHWSLPPQEIEFLNKNTENLPIIKSEHYDDAKKVIHKLQVLEWLFINAVVPDQYNDYKKKLIDRIREHYELFSVNTTPKSTSSRDGWYGYTLALLSLPRNLDEGELLLKIKHGQTLINNLYMAVDFNLKIDENYVNDVPAHEADFHPVDALASYLTEEDKIELCKIIGRTYVEPESEDEFSEEEMMTQPNITSTHQSSRLTG